jgi:hypothetical protein
MSTLARSVQQPETDSSFAKTVPAWISDFRVSWLVFGILAALIWVPRMAFRGFWVDEAGTFWMASNGPIAAIQKTWHWPGQSILYSVIASFFCLSTGPLRELVLRLPSALGMAVSAYFVYKLAESAVGKNAGFLGVVLLTFNPLSLQLGCEARPYALALGAAAASTWFIYSYLQTGRRSNLAAYIAVCTAVVYLHYFFVVVFGAQLLYAVYVSTTGRRSARWIPLLGSYLVVAMLATPLIAHFRLLFNQAHTLPLPRISVWEVLADLMPVLLVFGLFLSALVVQFLVPASANRTVSVRRSILVLGGSLWLFGPVVLYLVSVVSKIQIYAPRYVAYLIIGEALLFAYAGWFTFESQIVRAWVLLAVLFSTASPLSMARSRQSGEEDLRPVMQLIRAESSKGNLPPVFFCSPLPESNSLNWKSGLATYLYAGFVAYPMPNQLLPLPYRLDKDAKQSISNRIDTGLKNAVEVLFITHDSTSGSWIPWMTAQMSKARFEPHIENSGAYVIVIFRRNN